MRALVAAPALEVHVGDLLELDLISDAREGPRLGDLARREPDDSDELRETLRQPREALNVHGLDGGDVFL